MNKSVVLNMFNEKECGEFLLKLKIPDYTQIACPTCKHGVVRKAKTEQKYLFTCARPKCQFRFNATYNTIFHGSKVGLSTWFTFLYLTGIKKISNPNPQSKKTEDKTCSTKQKNKNWKLEEIEEKEPLYKIAKQTNIHPNTASFMWNTIKQVEKDLASDDKDIKKQARSKQLDLNRIIKHISKRRKRKITSFVNYPGAKGDIIDEIIKRLPANFNNYYEPFYGGGNVLFGMHDILFQANGNLYISDFNKDLITTHNEVKNNPDKLIEYLQEHDQNYSKEYCNKVCDEYRTYDNTKLAASFIFLTKSGFHGMIDFEEDGSLKRNFSKIKPSSIVNAESIFECSKILNSNPNKLSILNQGFEDIESKVQKDDFVYLDPPYYANGKDIINYGSGLETEDGQKRIRDFVLRLHHKGAYIMLSNFDSHFIREIYGDKSFKIDAIDVGSNQGRRSEVLVRNY